MKKCPKCGKTYDDTWQACLNDSAALIDVAGKSTPEIRPASETVKKRPMGIIVIAVLLSLSGLSGTLSLIGMMAPPPSAEFNIERLKQRALQMNPNATQEERAKISKMEMTPAMQDMVKAQNEFVKSGKYKAMTMTYGVLGLLSLIAGIGLFMSKEWARKLGIACQLLSIPVFVFNILIFRSAFNIFSEHIKGAKEVFPVMVGVQAILGLVIIWLIISYLQRPQVKKWFV